MAALRPLTPEQLGWSVLQVTGRLPSRIERFERKLQETAAKQAAEKKKPEKGQQQEETSRVATEPDDRNWRARQQAYTELASELSGLVGVFSRLPGQPDNGFQPSVDQALFLLNSEQMVKFMKDSQLLERLLRLEEKPGELVTELYLSVLSRAPVDEEQGEVARLFAAAADRDQRREVIRRIMWGLLVSAEFRLNH